MSKSAGSYTRYVLLFWAVFFCGFTALALILTAAAYGLLGPLPPFEVLENPKSVLASEVWSSDGVLLGKYYLEENRSNATIEEISPHLINALVATEDIRFRDHSGIDTRGLLRVIFKTVLLGQDAGGGSTITQQLAKNLFHGKPKSKPERIRQKFKEWIIASKLERSYTKEEIIKNYLNTVPFSGHSYGIKSAAREFFNKTTDSLAVQEAAVLIGMLKATNRYNPVIHPENSLERRNLVLSQMTKYGFLTGPEGDSLKKLPIALNYFSIEHNEGLAKYFREHLRMELKRWCSEHHYNLYTDGLKIYTTIDSRMQRYAEKALTEHLSELQRNFFEHWKKRDPWGKDVSSLEEAMKHTDRYRRMKAMKLSKDSIQTAFHIPVKMNVFTWGGIRDTVMTPWDSLRHYKLHLRAGFMAMEPKTGYIRAWVGGADYSHFKYDHVTSQRQIGSTFKPFVYSVAINEGFSPCLELPNVPITFEKGEEYGLIEEWTPKNSDNKHAGEWLSLTDGLAHSVNIITARIMAEIKPAVVVQLVKRMGITSEVPAYPSICLGTPDISLFEMVGAYGTFINKGFYKEPMFISHIEDKNGNIIPGFIPKNEEAMDEQTAYIMTEMLKNVVNRGTGIGLRYRYKIEGDLAGKTGTTQEHADGWFIGFTPQIVAGAWVGGDDRTVRFRSLDLGQGARLAMPIFAKFLISAYEDKSLGLSAEATFEKPEEPLTIELDCTKYKQPVRHSNKDYGNIYESQ